MEKERIYKALPWPLQNAACNWYGWKEKRLRMGKQFDSYLAWFKKLEHSDWDEIRHYQDLRVSRLIEFACKYVPYYQKRFAEFGVHPSQINSIADLGKLWSSQDLVDTCLGMLSSCLKFVWTNPTEMLVSTGAVVEHIDVV